MPAYNAANYIQEAIDSVINQTFVDWELIIVDDGSTDHKKDIITAKNVLVDERIHYYYQENGKQGKARNLAIKIKRKYLAFLDADDLWIPQKIRNTTKRSKKRMLT
jgi:glycosyltransferase involved in cell wall biosynthesis